MLFDHSSIFQRCEVGDLAGKFGAIPLDGRINVTDMTGLLSLQGRYSIIGRSVVIHRHDDGTNFVCGTIRLMEEQQGLFTSVVYGK